MFHILRRVPKKNHNEKRSQFLLLYQIMQPRTVSGWILTNERTVHFWRSLVERGKESTHHLAKQLEEPWWKMSKLKYICKLQYLWQERWLWHCAPSLLFGEGMQRIHTAHCHSPKRKLKNKTYKIAKRVRFFRTEGPHFNSVSPGWHEVNYCIKRIHYEKNTSLPTKDITKYSVVVGM
jgi:hypothetical protein